MSEDDDKKQYPGYFKGKKIRVEVSSGGMTKGTLRDFVRYQDFIFLVLEIGTASKQDLLINLNHVVAIEEGVN